MIPFQELRLHHFGPGTDAQAIRAALTKRSRGDAWIAAAGSSLPLAAVLCEWSGFMMRQKEVSEETLGRSRTEGMAMRPSALHPGEPAEAQAVTELRILEIHGEQSSQAAQVLSEIDLPHLVERGAALHAVYDVLLGYRTPAIVLMLSWSSPDSAARAWASLDARIDRRRLVDKLSETLHRPLFDSYRHWFLTPVEVGRAA